jgi:hypothetical protein
MYEFWSQDKLLLMIGLFQFGLILIMFMIFSMGKRKRNRKVKSNNLNTSNAVTTDVTNNPINNEINLNSTLPYFIDQPLTTSAEPIGDIQASQANPTEIDLPQKVDIAPELLTELWEISNNPAAIVDEAIRWWLRRRNIDDLDSGMRDRRYQVGLRSHDAIRSSQHLWND